MRSTTTAVLERNTTIGDGFASEPYEVPWATEARFFVHVLERIEAAPLEFSTEISPDGQHWCELDGRRHPISDPGLLTWSVAEFGQWLRISCRARDSTGQPVMQAAKVRIYLVGKS